MFNKLVSDTSFGEAVEMLRLEFKNDITTYEELVDYCICELQTDGDFAAVTNVLKTLDESYGYWVYDYAFKSLPPKPILSADDLDRFFDEDCHPVVSELSKKDDGYTYFLLKNRTDGQPWEMLRFVGKVNQCDVQRTIDSLNNYYIDNEELIDDACAYDFMINRLDYLYSFDVVPWDCEDNLYY